MDSRLKPFQQALGVASVLNDLQSEAHDQLFPVRLITREPPPNGAHIRMVARADDGHLYYCKDDGIGIPSRMREAFFSQLAGEVNLASPDFRIVEDESTGETFFGSRRMPSTADELARVRFLRTERKDELGRHRPFPGRWLSQQYAFDMFVHNWDRSAANLIAISEGSSLRLRPVDFTAAELALHPVAKFPDGNTETVRVARDLRTVHGFFADSAIQMLDLLKAVPPAVINGFFNAMPIDWVDVGERERICEFWSGPDLAARLDALRAGLSDGRLL